MGDSKLNDEKRTALLTLLLDVHRARKDARAQGETIEQLQKYNIDISNDPSAARTMADLTLSIARSSMEQKKYEKVLSDIEARKQSFIDPAQQVEALFLIAEARNALAADVKEPAKLKDLALAYMRVVAFSQGLPNTPQVSPALYNAAQLLEKANEPADALRLYRDVAKTQSPVADKAREAIQRLSK